ncbi:MAG: glycosyltransferase family 4 protein [Anaerolineae bacterium]|nr:glycosyltransferase family 4 protein [Anaerolineae bacterium]
MDNQNKPMRIGIITGEYPPMEGGVGDFTHELGKALHALGHNVHVLTTSVKDMPEMYRDHEITIYRQIKHWGSGVHNRITHWIQTIQPDVVNLQYQAAAYQMNGNITLYPRLQRRHLTMPFVVTCHDLLPPYLFPKAGRLRSWTVRQLTQHSNGVIVTNYGDETTMSHQLENTGTPLRFIPIGSNIAPEPPMGYTPARWRASHDFGAGELLIGFFGFLNRSKGIETLLYAIANLVQKNLPVHLLFIGGRTGSSDVTNLMYADEVDRLIAQLNLTDRVRRTGFVSPEAVSAALLAVDVCALPYRTGASLWRGTLHAALVHGCPIVTTTPQDNTPQLCHGENVILVPPDDVAALTDAICRLWENPQLRARLGKAAAALAQQFTWEHIATQTVGFFSWLNGPQAESRAQD